MKKKLSILALSATVLLSACGNTSTTKEAQTISSVEQTNAINIEDNQTATSISVDTNDVDDVTTDNETDTLIAELESNYGITEPMSFARGDSTGNWRIARAYTNASADEFVVDYAKAYMQSGDVHFIVNFYLNTTTMLRLNNEILNVRITEYVDKEENDASTIGNGMFLKEESYDMSNGQLFSDESDENAGTVLSYDLVSKVKEVIDDAVGENEKITDVVLNDSTLTICVDLSEANTSILSAKDIALMRISSITDEILDLDDNYTNTWETIVIDFGKEGKAQLNKSMIVNSGYGKYFDYTDDILQ